MSRVLVAERDRALAERLEGPLARSGWSVISTARPAETRAALFNREPLDLVLLDVRLSGSGELLRELIAAVGPPVILVGDRAREDELIAGLRLGADDYLVEPCGTPELLARSWAAIRRRRRAQPPSSPRSGPHRVGPLLVDPALRRVTLEGQRVELTRREYALLLALVGRSGEVVSRDELIAAVWGEGWMGTGKVLDVQISALRRKLGDDPERARLIHTARGVGFALVVPEDDPER